MQGEHDLSKLLRTLKGHLHDGVFVFVTLPDRVVPVGLSPRMMFEEVEGTTLILAIEEAEEAGLPFEFPSRMITLDVHSSLEAVGFMAVVASALAREGMSVNPVAGFFHDHIFVPDGREQDALAVLEHLAQNGS